jgi:hypothetical protein
VTSFDPVALPTIDPAQPEASVLRSIATWLDSAPFVALVDKFGGAGLTPGEPLASRLAKLDAFSDRWDFRKGGERYVEITTDLDADEEHLALAAATALGLVTPVAPRHRDYDHVLVLGGMVRACVLRPRRAAELLGESVSAPAVTALGAFRELGGDEPELAAAAGLAGIETEYDAMEAGMRQAFGLRMLGEERSGNDPNPFLSWRVRTFRDREGRPIAIVAAPTTDPTRRANTPDTYAYWARNLAKLRPGQRILLVTTTIYVPYQHVGAIGMLGLPYGVEVDTVGVDPSDARHEDLRQDFTAQKYLQELRSTIRGMRSLVDRLT